MSVANVRYVIKQRGSCSFIYILIFFNIIVHVIVRLKPFEEVIGIMFCRHVTTNHMTVLFHSVCMCDNYGDGVGQSE